MKNITVTLENYPSKYYPVIARYTRNKTKYCLVFENVKQAKREIDFMLYGGVLYNLKFIDKTGSAEK